MRREPRKSIGDGQRWPMTALRDASSAVPPRLDCFGSPYHEGLTTGSHLPFSLTGYPPPRTDITTSTMSDRFSRAIASPSRGVLDPIVVKAGFTFSLTDERPVVRNHFKVDPASSVPHTQSSNLTCKIDKFLRKSADRFEKESENGPSKKVVQEKPPRVSLYRTQSRTPDREKPPRTSLYRTQSRTPERRAFPAGSSTDSSLSLSPKPSKLFLNAKSASGSPRSSSNSMSLAERNKQILSKIVAQGTRPKRYSRYMVSSTSSATGDDETESESDVGHRPVGKSLYDRSQDTSTEISKLDDLSSGSDDDDFYDVHAIPGYFCIPNRPTLGCQHPFGGGFGSGLTLAPGRPFIVGPPPPVGSAVPHSSSLPAVNKLKSSTKMGNNQTSPQLKTRKKYQAPVPPALSREGSFVSAHSVIQTSANESTTRTKAENSTETNKKLQRNSSFRKYPAPKPPIPSGQTVSFKTTSLPRNGSRKSLNVEPNSFIVANGDTNFSSQSSLEKSSDKKVASCGLNPEKQKLFTNHASSINTNDSYVSSQFELGQRSCTASIIDNKCVSSDISVVGNQRENLNSEVGTPKQTTDIISTTVNADSSTFNVRTEIESAKSNECPVNCELNENTTLTNEKINPIERDKLMNGLTGNSNIVDDFDETSSESSLKINVFVNKDRSQSLDKSTSSSDSKEMGRRKKPSRSKSRTDSRISSRRNSSSKDDEKKSNANSRSSSRGVTPDRVSNGINVGTVKSKSGKLAALTNKFEDDQSRSKEPSKKLPPKPQINKGIKSSSLVSGIANKFGGDISMAKDNRVQNPYSQCFDPQTVFIEKSTKTIRGIAVASKFGEMVKPANFLKKKKALVVKDTVSSNTDKDEKLDVRIEIDQNKPILKKAENSAEEEFIRDVTLNSQDEKESLVVTQKETKILKEINAASDQISCNSNSPTAKKLLSKVSKSSSKSKISVSAQSTSMSSKLTSTDDTLDKVASKDINKQVENPPNLVDYNKQVEQKSEVTYQNSTSPSVLIVDDESNVEHNNSNIPKLDVDQRKDGKNNKHTGNVLQKTDSADAKSDSTCNTDDNISKDLPVPELRPDDSLQSKNAFSKVVSVDVCISQSVSHEILSKEKEKETSLSHNNESIEINSKNLPVPETECKDSCISNDVQSDSLHVPINENIGSEKLSQVVTEAPAIEDSGNKAELNHDKMDANVGESIENINILKCNQDTCKDIPCLTENVILDKTQENENNIIISTAIGKADTKVNEKEVSKSEKKSLKDVQECSVVLSVVQSPQDTASFSENADQVESMEKTYNIIVGGKNVTIENSSNTLEDFVNDQLSDIELEIEPKIICEKLEIPITIAHSRNDTSPSAEVQSNLAEGLSPDTGHLSPRLSRKLNSLRHIDSVILGRSSVTFTGNTTSISCHNTTPVITSTCAESIKDPLILSEKTIESSSSTQQPVSCSLKQVTSEEYSLSPSSLLQGMVNSLKTSFSKVLSTGNLSHQNDTKSFPTFDQNVNSEVVVTEVPVEVAVTEGPLEVAVTEGPLEVAVTEGPLEVAVTEGHLEVAVTEVPLEVAVTEGPLEVAVTEVPLEVTVTEGSLEVAVTEVPLVEVVVTEVPFEEVVAEVPLEVRDSKSQDSSTVKLHQSRNVVIPDEVLNISQILKEAEDRLNTAIQNATLTIKRTGSKEEIFSDAFDPSQFDTLMPLPLVEGRDLTDRRARSCTPFMERFDRAVTPNRAMQQTEAMLSATDRILKKSRSQHSLRRSFERSLSRININNLAEVSADLHEEHSAAHSAGERIEAEQAERMRLEKEVSQLQVDVKQMTNTNGRLEMEKLALRSEVLQHSDLNGDLNNADDAADASLYKRKYEWCLREMEVIKKQLIQQQEDDYDQLLTLKKQLEKKVSDAFEETDEQRQIVGQLKKKSQRLQAEMNDMKILLEEQSSRNNLLEKKQRKFDQDIQSVHEEHRNERLTKDKIQREKDQILAEKYSYEQEVSTLKLEVDLKEERISSLRKELNDLNFTGKAEEEVVLLKKAKHDMELRVKDQEEELDDLAGQVQMLEAAKIRLEMSIEQMRKENRKESQLRDEEVEEIRVGTQKKIKALECQLECEHEERTQLVREKHDLERRLLDAHDRNFATVDEDSFHKVKKELKKTKALLKDTQTMLEKNRGEGSNKLLLRQMKTQLEDVEFARTAAIKARQSAECEVNELQSHLDDISKSKKDSDDKCLRITKEKTEIQSQLEESEEELAEVIKKYKATVSQLSIDQINISEQSQLISELEHDKQIVQDRLIEMTSKVEVLEGETANIHTQRRLQMKIKELESKLDLESTTKTRLESQITRLKDQMERFCSEMESIRMKESQAIDHSKKLNRQLREAKEDASNMLQKYTDAISRKQDVEKQQELSESEIITLKSDLKLAFKRIEDLQQALMGDLSDSDTELTDSDSDTDISLTSFFASSNARERTKSKTPPEDPASPSQSKMDMVVCSPSAQMMSSIREDDEYDLKESFA